MLAGPLSHSLSGNSGLLTLVYSRGRSSLFNTSLWVGSVFFLLLITSFFKKKFSPPYFQTFKPTQPGALSYLSGTPPLLARLVQDTVSSEEEKHTTNRKQAATWLLFIFPPVKDYTKTMRRTAGKGNVAVNAVCLCAWLCTSVFPWLKIVTFYRKLIEFIDTYLDSCR